MSDRPAWWDSLVAAGTTAVEGLVPVRGYVAKDRPAEEVYLIEKAREYGADAVFFELEQYGGRTTAQAFVYADGNLADDQQFALQHRKLWSWGGVPLVYRRKLGLLQLFRCAHGPDFLTADGRLQCNPIRELQIAAYIELDPWWDEQRIRSGTLWSDPQVCDLLLSAQKAAHKSLFNAFKDLSDSLDTKNVLPKRLRRRLLILSLLIAYLEQRGVFPEGFFGDFLPGGARFFEVLGDGPSLIKLLTNLEDRFNGRVFRLSESDTQKLLETQQLGRFARLLEAREDAAGQLSLWDLYSFRDLPVELISQIYQLFVRNADSSVYTPPFLVQFLVEEALSWETLDRITTKNQLILDPACGSGIFLVEAYKRLVLHWRARNHWKRPDQHVLKKLLEHVRGVDLEEDAVELAGFSLCLALCDALQPEEIRRSIKLFPDLRAEALHHGCFFEAKEQGLVPGNVGAVLGNPPFDSRLQTPGAARAYRRYREAHGSLPDKQVGYLFLHEAADSMADGATLSMLQQYNFLYNQRSLEFRKKFLEQYWVREFLDFVSVRGLFQKGSADTKVVVVVAQKMRRPDKATLLHATFRRTGRIDAEQGLDLDYYDLHFIPYATALSNDRVWRADLLGGGRALDLVDRLAANRTLRDFAKEQDWEFGEGFIVGDSVKRVAAPHLTGKAYLPPSGLTQNGIDPSKIRPLKDKLFRSAYTAERFTPPMLLVSEHMNLAHAVWTDSYLTYSQRMVGFCAPRSDLSKLRSIEKWLTTEKRTLQAYQALTSTGLFAQKATALQANDIYSIPYPVGGRFELSANERIVVDDIVDFQSELIRLGESSAAMRHVTAAELTAFAEIYARQISAIYPNQPLSALGHYSWSGATCQAYCFGNGKVDWTDADDLKDRVDALIKHQPNERLQMTRICRLYDGRYLFLLKPDRLRYWLRSIALRDADETLADLRAQGY